MEIQELCAGVSHWQPQPHHLPPQFMATKSTDGPGSDPVEPAQDLAPEVGAPSRNPVQHSSGPFGRGDNFFPLPSGVLRQLILPVPIHRSTYQAVRLELSAGGFNLQTHTPPQDSPLTTVMAQSTRRLSTRIGRGIPRTKWRSTLVTIPITSRRHTPPRLMKKNHVNCNIGEF